MTQNSIVDILNQLCELEKKVEQLSDNSKYMRNIHRIRDKFEREGFRYHNPMHEDYTETRTDLEAEISGSCTQNLKVIEVIKPVIYRIEGNKNTIIQPAMVIVSHSN